MFLVLEGADGVGKTTQIQLLEKYLLNSTESEVLCLREPGGTDLGLEIRKLLLDPNSGDLSAKTEAFLFMAARSHLVENVIQPSLNIGKHIICDRFLWSSVVYQGIVGGLGVEEILDQGQLATGGVLPDLTILLDLPLEESKQRISERGENDRFEQKGEGYLLQVREGFLKLAKKYPKQIIVVSASGSEEEVHARIIQALKDHALA